MVQGSLAYKSHKRPIVLYGFCCGSTSNNLNRKLENIEFITVENSKDGLLIRYIILDGLLIRYESWILNHIPYISFDISLFDIKYSHSIQTRFPIFRTLLIREYGEIIKP